MEGRFPLEPEAGPGKVLVIGGGPAGMSAAVAAARRGFEVELWEASGRLGGQLAAASGPPFKADVRRLLDYMTRQLEQLGIETRLGVTAHAEEIAAESPDAVVVAVGAKPVRPRIPGAEKAVQAERVLCGMVPDGARAVVAGGGVVGCEAALFLAAAGREVTVVDAEAIVPPDRLFALNRASLVSSLEKAGVRTKAPAELVAVTDEGARVLSGGEETVLEADFVVLALGYEANGRLAQELVGRSGFEVRVVGDAVSPRRVLDAVWEGFHAARLL